MERILWVGTASLVAIAAAVGTMTIMAIDLLGANFIEKLKFVTEAQDRKPSVEKALEGTKDITFFKSVRVEGKNFSIMMGITFATAEDMRAGKQKSRWCYITVRPVEGGMLRQIELATQQGARQPEYSDLSKYAASELAVLGETAQSLADIARQHCVFTKEPGGPGTLARRLTIALRGEPA